MSAIWQFDGNDWAPLEPVGFSDEAALHDLIAEAPHLLPLSGSPRLAVVGSRVSLGSNQADVIAIEPSGRVVLIEVKLGRSSEARRAVVGQVLSYAAFLRGLTTDSFERDVLGTHLQQRGFENLASAAAEADQEGAFDPEGFLDGIGECLRSGSFRLVLVLDDAPEELIRVVGYLEEIGERLDVDLITVAAFDVDGSRLLVPQRVDPGRADAAPTAQAPRPARRLSGETTESADAFLQRISESDPAEQEKLSRLAHWARGLEQDGVARLRSYVADRSSLLLVWVPGEEAGLVTIWNDNGAYLSVWRSVFERKARETIPRVEELLAPTALGQGNTTRDVSDELLQALSDAYRAAAPRPSGRFDWSRAAAALNGLPEGAWTTYGDIAQFVGTSAIAVGRWVTSSAAPKNAFRVLGADGKARPDFRWNDPSETRELRHALEEVGVRIDGGGVADPVQRLGPDALSRLVAAS